MDPTFSELHANIQRTSIDFLQTDLDLCSTFVDLAHTELESMKDRDAALWVIGRAEEGHVSIARLLVHLDEGPNKDAIQQQLTELRVRLDSFQQKLHPPG